MTEQERQDQAELESFGTTYTNSRGARCLRLGMLGVRIDACSPFKGTVESFRAIEGSGWWELNIRERQGEHFFLHNNRVAEIGELETGEEVEGIIDTISGNRFW